MFIMNLIKEASGGNLFDVNGNGGATHDKAAGSAAATLSREIAGNSQRSCEW